MSLYDLHCAMLRVRRSEELLAALYPSGEMKTPTHFSIGSEAVEVGVCAALQNGDTVTTHHRSHAAYLAMGAPFQALAAELYGKESGCSGGRGGSVHLTSREHGFLASSAILGQSIALAAGAALSFKMSGENRVAVAFFGDAAMEEGIASETFTFAALHGLPLVAVCEDNGWSTETPMAKRLPAGTTLGGRASAMGMEVTVGDGRDVEAVYHMALVARDRAHMGTPQFLHLTTDRWLEHVGPHYDHEQGRTHRTADDLALWMQRDPLRRSYNALSSQSKAAADSFDVGLKEDLAKQAEAAHGAANPVPADLFKNVGP